MTHANASLPMVSSSTDSSSFPVVSPAPVPPNLATGITEITWTGFANQTFTLKPVTNSALTLPPIQVSLPGKMVFYSDAIRVEAKYIPKPIAIGPNGPWFVQRQTWEGFDPSKDPKPPTLVNTTTISINSQGLAVSKAGSLAIDLGAKEGRWLRYRLGRWVTIMTSNKPKKVLQLLDDYVDVYPLPDLGQPAYTDNMYRPLPCEFETVKFEILGKKGQVLQTLKAGETTPINVSFGDAKTQFGSPDNPILIYAARWTVKRKNHPNFAPTKGYVIQSGNVGNVFINELSPVVSGLTLADTIGQEFVIPFEVRRSVNSGPTTRQLCLGNAVTNGKFVGQVFASIQAETNLVLHW